jgi:hypothetical protein
MLRTSSGALDSVPGFSWIDLPMLGGRQEPADEREGGLQGARTVLCRPALPLLVDVGNDLRRSEGREAYCEASRGTKADSQAGPRGGGGGTVGIG